MVGDNKSADSGSDGQGEPQERADAGPNLSGAELLSLFHQVPVVFALVGLDRRVMICTDRFVDGFLGLKGTPEQGQLYDLDAVALISQQLGTDIEQAFLRATNGVPSREPIPERRVHAGLIPRSAIWFRGVANDDRKIWAVAVGTSEGSADDSSVSVPRLRSDSLFGEWLYNDNLVESVVNDRWFSIMGYSREDLGELSVSAFWNKRMHPEDLNRLDVQTAHQLLPVVEYRMLHADGVYRWMRSEGWPVRLNPDQSIQLSRGAIYNVDDERRERTAIESAFQRSLDLLDGSAEAVIAVGADGIIVSANNSAMNLVRAHGTMVGQPFNDVVPLKDPVGNELSDSILAASLAKNRGSVPEAVLTRSDGETVTVAVSVELVDVDQNRPVLTVVRMRDLTHLLALASQRDLNERVQAMGSLVSGIAHDLNNYLGIARGVAEVVENDKNFAQLTPSTRESIRLLLRASDQASELTTRLLPLENDDRSETAPADVHSAIRFVADLLRFTANNESEVRLDLQASNPVVDVSRLEVENALLNLILNAFQAMPDGGVVTVRTGDRELDETDPQVSAETVEPGYYCQVEVIDNGSGISPEDQTRIFEPFYSTRSDGTGLGLISVFRLVSDSKGSVEVDSELGRGTTVRLLLPAKTQPYSSEPETPDNPTGVTLAHHDLSVLVADDDESVARVVQSMLETMGCQASVVSDGARLVQTLQGGHDYDVVLLDLSMPVMGGQEALRRIRSLPDDVPIICVSGLVTEARRQALLAAGANVVISKPVSLASLDRALTEATESE